MNEWVDEEQLQFCIQFCIIKAVARGDVDTEMVLRTVGRRLAQRCDTCDYWDVSGRDCPLPESGCSEWQSREEPTDG